MNRHAPNIIALGTALLVLQACHDQRAPTELASGGVLAASVTPADPAGRHLTQRRTVFETVAGTASRNPDVSCLRMAVQNEVPVPRLLVLAHARLDQGRTSHRRKSEFQIVARGADAFRGGNAVAEGGVNRRAALVARHLQPAPLIPRNAVKLVLAVVNPHR